METIFEWSEPIEKQTNEMTGSYKDFYFTTNTNTDLLIKQEVPVFYNNLTEYSCGNYYRIIFPQASQLSGVTGKKLYKEALNSLFYLNLNMTIEQFNKIYNYWKKVDGFNFNYSYYKHLYDNIDKLERKNCYGSHFTVVINEKLFAERNSLAVGSKELKQLLTLWYKQNARKVYSEWLGWELKDYFFEHISSYDLSIEKFMNVFEIKKRETIIKHLKEYDIKFYATYIEYKENNEIKTIPYIDFMDSIIKTNISYYIKVRSRLITPQLLTSKCKYENNEGRLIILTGYKLKEFFKNNKDEYNRVKLFNKLFVEPEKEVDKSSLVEEEKKEDYSFLGIDDSEFDNLKVNYTRKSIPKKVAVIDDLDDLDEYWLK